MIKAAKDTEKNMQIIKNAIMNSKKNDQAVAKYRQEHPDTKLSYNEILENIYKK